MTDYIDKYDAPKELMPLIDAAENYWAEYKRLDGQRPIAIIITLIGIGLFFGGVIFSNPDVGLPLGAVGGAVGASAGFWLYVIHQSLSRNAELSMRTDDQLRREGWVYLPDPGKLYRPEN